jgi:hypothetical protein
MSRADGRIDRPYYRSAAPSRTIGDRLITLVGLACLIAADVALRTVGFAGICRRLPQMHTPWRRAHEPKLVRRLYEGVDRAGVYYVRQVHCLTRSIATIAVLRLAGFSSELVIGVQRMPFGAHAWVEADGQILNDHPARCRGYAVITRC